MKVLIAAPSYLPSRRANTIQVMKMAQAIQSIGHVVRILVPDHENVEKPGWDILAKHYGLQQHLDIQWVNRLSSLRNYDYGIKVIHKFRNWGGDILYTRLPQAAALGSILNIPTIYEVHDLPGGRVGPWLFRIFIRGRGARRLVVISKALRDAIHNQIYHLPVSSFCVTAPDGVDKSRYETIPSPYEARESLQAGPVPQLSIQKFTVGYTGHLYEGRGISLILDIAQHSSELNFLLVGGDPPRVDEVRTEVARRSLDNVILTGFIENMELPLYQAACEVLLMPYQRIVAASSGGNIAHYLSPMKLFEYMASGRVILSSDLPIFEEVLNDDNSIMLPPDDLGRWVKTLKEIQNNLPRYQILGKQAREDSLKFTWSSRAERVFSFPNIDQ
jgi:glycosyltransferase involved in cell wall biosynthesis